MATSTHTIPDLTQEKFQKLKEKTGISINAWIIIAINKLLKENEDILK